MEQLGWWIYLATIIGNLRNISVVVLISTVSIFGIVLIILNESLTFKDIKKWSKYISIISIICTITFIFAPSKTEIYQILGANAVVKVVKNSESLQQMPEKTFDAINRFLDSVCKDDE